MRISLRKILLIPWFLLWCFIGKAQYKSFFWGNNNIELSRDTNSYQTIIYGTQNGLVSSEITCLEQDSKGYLWVGTSSGVSRYDGNDFENFLKAEDNFVGKIYAIKDDTLRKAVWIACDAGLCYYKNNELHLVNFKEKPVVVYDVFFLKDKSMWVGTGMGPMSVTAAIANKSFSTDTLSVTSLLLPKWLKMFGNNSPVFKITQSESGKAFFASRGVAYSYKAGDLKKIWDSKNQKNNNDNVVGFVPLSGDSVLFATVLSAMYLVAHGEVNPFFDDNYVTGDLLQRNGQVYYFTSAGIYRFQRSTASWEKISQIPEHLNLWISCLLVDNENNIWIGLHDNLLYQKPKIFFQYHNQPGAEEPELYSVLQLENRKFLFGSNRGKIYSRDGNKFRNIFGSGQVLPSAEIKNIYKDSRGWMWLGSGYQGVVLIKNRDTIRLTKKDGLGSNSNYFIHEDRHGNIYTGGDGGFSRISVDPSSGNYSIKSFYYLNPGDNLQTFQDCVEAGDGSLWLGGQKGLFHLQNDSLIHFALSGEMNVNISDIKKDKNDNIWITTRGDGIWQCVFDKNNQLKLRKKLSVKDGLQANIYLTLTIDNENDIWAGGYSGITSVRVLNGGFNITNYNAADGFLSNNYQSLKLFCDNSDTIWAIASAGLTTFYSGNIHLDRKLILNLTGVSLIDTAAKISSYNKNNELELPSSQGDLEFRFKGICLSAPQKIVYSYRLIGLRDTAWLEWTNKEIAIYRNLSPGDYMFQVKASIDPHTITIPVSYAFTITKPFWLKWWFLIGSAIIIMSLGYLAQRRLRKTIQYKHDEKIKTEKLISENLQYQLEVEQVTNYFTTSMSTRETVDDLLWDVARQCISKLNFEDCVIYLKDQKTGILSQKAAWGPKGKLAEKDGADSKIISPIEIPLGKGIVGTVAATGVPEIIGDVTNDSRYIKDDEQRSAEIAVPIIYDGDVLGVIDSESRVKDFYSQRHLKILTTIASHCAERIVKLRTDENLHENQLELLQAQNRLAEEKLTALRSQMNPHFIFNCLNSIQQFILTGDVDNANKYLSRFSKLIRLVLQYSENNFISLEEEIDMLELYLSLEKTRFGNSFEYKILVDHELDTDEIKIPNLMIQPFVENAIWHGLMHKEDDRKIYINFQMKEEEFIVCEVIDNGIGRKRAGEIRQAKSVEVKHKSRGMQLIKDKLDILRQQFQSEVLIDISDVTGVGGEVLGTKVLIQLPLQYQ